MGTTSSKKRYGSMQIEGINTEYFSGTIISGILKIDVSQDIESNQLTIQLIGYEYVNFVRLVSPDDNAARDISANNTKKQRPIHSEILNQAPKSKYFYKGAYSFPFNFKIPTNMPSSFNIKFRKGQEMCYGGINYIIKATLGKGSKTITIERPILVKESYSTDIVTDKINDKKQVNDHNYSVTLNKNVFIIGDSIKATLTFDNSGSKEKIKNFEWKVEFRITFSSGSTTHDMLMELNRGTLEGVLPNENYEKTFIIENTIPNSDLHNSITFKGQLVKISYVLKIYANSPVLSLFNKKTKIKFFLNLINYKPENYAITTQHEDNYRIDVVSSHSNDKNVLKNANNNILNSKTQISSDIKSKEIVYQNQNLKLEGNEPLDRRFGTFPYETNKGFSYPEMNSLSPDKQDSSVYYKFKRIQSPTHDSGPTKNDLAYVSKERKT